MLPWQYSYCIPPLQFSSKLGDGEFGPVYQGFAKELVAGESDTLVAIKMLLHPRDSDDDSSSGVQDIDNFRAQMKLQYTNIASILAMCTDIRPYYIVYEYLDCVSVSVYLCVYRVAYTCVCRFVYMCVSFCVHVCVVLCTCVCVCVGGQNNLTKDNSTVCHIYMRNV